MPFLRSICSGSYAYTWCMLFLTCYWTLQMACNVSKFTKFGLTLAFIHVYSGLDSSLLMVKGFWRQGSPPLS